MAFFRLVQNLGPEQTQQQYPQLSLAQIHAALAYYYDHRHALAPAIQARLQHPLTDSEHASTRKPDKPTGMRLAELVGSVPYDGPCIPDALLQAPVDLHGDQGNGREPGA